jgi:diadenosine tetraphosphate (Ap4A) HIT family hydrolase
VPPVSCVFCAIAAATARASVVLDAGDVLAFMDHRPWRRGHLLVIPRAHGARLADLPAATVAATFALASELVVAVRGAGLPCHDVNLIVNDGPAAGQTVAHVHVHVVPRVRGDLWRMAALMLGRVLPPAPRDGLDDDARAIAQALARHRQRGA